MNKNIQNIQNNNQQNNQINNQQNNQQNNIKIDLPLPDTLIYTSNEISENELLYGKYKTNVLSDEIESIKSQSEIMKEHVRESMRYLWKGYVECAFGYDEMRPLSCSFNNNYGGIGLFMIDSIDTMYLMDLTVEYKKAESWLKEKLDFDQSQNNVNEFELTIRVLGGLLGMYTLSSDDFYLKKAVELGDIIYNTFKDQDLPNVFFYKLLEINLFSPKKKF